MGCRGCSFIIVNTVSLGIAFRDISDFVVDDVPRVIMFALADQFSFQGLKARGYVRAGDEDEDFEVGQAL